MREFKVKIGSHPDVSRLAQEHAFKLGYAYEEDDSGGVCDIMPDVGFLYFGVDWTLGFDWNGDSNLEHFENHVFKEISLDEFFNMTSEKEAVNNDINFYVVCYFKDIVVLSI